MNFKIIGLIAFLTIALVSLSGCIQPAVCGNSICELEENEASCPQDCRIGWCGDGTCNQDETPESCPADCGNPNLCGNGTCDTGENETNCPQDCGNNNGETGDLLVTVTSKITTANAIEFRPIEGAIVSLKSDKIESYYEGEIVSGLVGRGKYADQDLLVKISAITQASATANYQARFDLINATNGIIIDTQTISAGQYLNKAFLDSEGDYALETETEVLSVNVEPTTSKGVVSFEINRLKKTDYQGEASFKSLKSGSYIMSINKEGYQEATRVAEVFPNKGKTELISLEPMVCVSDSDCSSGKVCCSKSCVTVACATSADCSDSDISTQDVCNSPGTCSSSCSNKVVFPQTKFCGQDGFYLDYMNSCYFEGALGQSCDKVCEGRGGCVTRYEDSTDLVNTCLQLNPGAADLEVDAYDKAFPYYTEEYNGNLNVCVSRKYHAPPNSCSASVASGQRTCKCGVKPAVCGDGVCEGAETEQNCATDCMVV